MRVSPNRQPMGPLDRAPTPPSDEAGAIWLEVSVVAPLAQVEPVADVLRRYAPGGVAIMEPVEPLGPDEGVRRYTDRPALLRAYLPPATPAAAIDNLRADLAAVTLAPPSLREVAEEDWAHAWKAHFRPQRVGRVLVCPPWRRPPARPGDVVVLLDPGMAFGTGQHPTTRACLRALQRCIRSGDAVLDLGTGSGVLAIAAAKLGASRTLALDVDAPAVAVARRNVEANGCADAVRVVAGSLGDLWPPGEPQAFDLILANINAVTLVELASPLAAAVRPGGTVIASGIVAERLASVLTAFVAAGLRLRRLHRSGDWRTPVLQRGG